MAQTDRQTDKAIHWKTAVFDVEGAWERLEKLPEFVKKVHLQEETCPTTGRPHRQIHVVCHRQVRLGQMRNWLPKTHWSPVFGKEHIANSIAYCSKKETAVVGTQRVLEGETFYKLSEIMELIAARCWYELKPHEWFQEIYNYNYAKIDTEYEAQFKFKNCAKYLVRDDKTWIDRLSNPMVAKMWNDFGGEFLGAAEERGSFIIEDPPVPPSEEFTFSD